MAWLGVRAGALNLLIPVGEVVEVVNPGPCTPVPLTLPCFRGLHNVRGTLYSVIDMPALLGFAPVPAGPEARLLLLAPQRIRNTALLVNRLSGMQADDALVEAEGAASVPAGQLLRRAGMALALGGSWLDARQAEWRVLDVAVLVALPEFLDVAAMPAQGAHA